MSQAFAIEVAQQNEVMIFTLSGSLEVSVQSQLKDKLEEIALKENDIVLDFSQVIFIDSSCLGTLVAVTKKIRAEKGNVKLACLSDDLFSIFQITRLDKIFDIYPSINEAIESYYQ